MTRATLWVLLPLCIVGALFWFRRESCKTLSHTTPRSWSNRSRCSTTVPTASLRWSGRQAGHGYGDRSGDCAGPGCLAGSYQGMLGTNGGGFFNANSAHPFENPTPLTQLPRAVLIFAIPAGLTYTLGRMTGSPRHGWAVWAAMAILFPAALRLRTGQKPTAIRCFTESTSTSAPLQSGGNMEGKEVRFGIANSALFATVTTDASCGAVNSMHDSFTPLGGMVPLINIMLGEVVFGGVGSGLYGICLCRSRGVYCRTDGGPHAGISGQEDRSL